MTQKSHDDVRQYVRDQYAKHAQSTSTGCCSTSVCGGSNQGNTGAISSKLGYSEQEMQNVPEGANLGLGCGNPQVIASLQEGNTVLDLGSGGGFDCFLASKAVGESGHVIGVDMTPDMISLARKNAEKNGYTNTEFRLGEIEHLPVADSSIDVIISNCVINLSPEKQSVFNEAYRVLRSGGRIAISDIVATGELSEAVKKDLTLYAGCMAGASTISALEIMLKAAGFEGIKITSKEESREIIRDWAPDSDMSHFVVSATIEAFKP